MNNKNQSFTPITCSIKEFFNYWLVFTKPFHKLANSEMDVFALFLYKRYEISKIIKGDNVIDIYLFSASVKDEIRQEAGISMERLQGILVKLRKVGVLSKDNKIDKRFIPDLSLDNPKNFNLLYQFTFND